ncbi:MAG: HlyD family efflux transporter periplasmic adaptor subunit [Bacteroidales bacterium]|jgi:HlyD family secretion protein|nr:HlyD family efflux transporter periplasmic adaptor subunit [Bacteroidales bacterium]
MKNALFLFFSGVLLVACNSNDKSDAYGNFEAIEVIISSQANGQIINLTIEEGMKINSGDTIGLTDTIDLSLKREQLISQEKVVFARLKNIDSQIRVQEQQKKNILVEKARVENLLRDEAATRKQMDDITGNLDLLEQQIHATEVQKEAVRAELATLDTQVKQVEETIRKCFIICPLSGTVLVKFAEAGEITSLGKPVCKIANLDELELKVYISGDQLPYLKLGQDVEVLIDKNRKEFTRLRGTVSWISPKSEFTPKTIQTKKERVNLVYAAKVKVPNDGTLKIGMPGEINFMQTD